MTWNEFKKHIDRQMEENDVDENMPIEYIDISWPCFDHATCIPELYWGNGTIAIH